MKTSISPVALLSAAPVLLFGVACGTPATPIAAATGAPATSSASTAPAAPQPAPLTTEAGWSVIARVSGSHPMRLLGGQDGAALVSIESKGQPHRWLRVTPTSVELDARLEKGMPAFTFDQPAPAEYGSPSFDSRGRDAAFLTLNRETEKGVSCEGFLWDGQVWASAGATTDAEGVCLLARLYTPGVGVALVEGSKGRVLRFFGKSPPASRPLGTVGKPAGDLTPVCMGTWASGEIVVVGVGGQAEVFAQGWAPAAQKPVIFSVPLDGNSPVDTRFPSPGAIEVYSGGVLPEHPNEEVAAKVVLAFDGKKFTQLSLGPGQTSNESVLIGDAWPRTATQDPRFALGFVGISGDDVYVTGTVTDGAVVESVVLRSKPVDKPLVVDR